MIKTNYLALTWSVSRGMSTYGYNICRLDDRETDKRYRCNGGGYDMVGSVVGEWLESTYQDRLLALDIAGLNLYGAQRIHFASKPEMISLHGAAGVDSMIRIAAAIGVRITANYNKRKRCNDGYFVTDFGSAEALQAADKE